MICCRKQKKTVTGILLLRGQGNGDSCDSCGKKEKSKRDCKDVFHSMSQLEVSI